MRQKRRREGRKAVPVADLGSIAVAAVSIWLGWQVTQAFLIQRLPPAQALGLSAASPEVLARAAEMELAAKRFDTAAEVASLSLAKAPFQVRSLRVLGLTRSEAGQEASANELLTLAGNWSLRDDPSHAWLVSYRLRKGDYGSAFAHADTLARRRPDTYPQVFNLFTSAAARDNRALLPLARLLGANPPWRAAYFVDLYKRPDGAAVFANLAIALEQTPGPMTATELQRLYSHWANLGRFAGLKFLRERIRRSSRNEVIQNPGFQLPMDDQLYPFGWRPGTGPGMTVSVIEKDDNSENLVLRYEYDGFGSTRAVEQLVMLDSGRYVLSGLEQIQAAGGDSRMAWELSCAETGDKLAEYRPKSSAAGEAGWRRFEMRFTVPESRCAAQWLRLGPVPGNRRSEIIASFDDVQILAERAAE